MKLTVSTRTQVDKKLKREGDLIEEQGLTGYMERLAQRDPERLVKLISAYLPLPPIYDPSAKSDEKRTRRPRIKLSDALREKMDKRDEYQMGRVGDPGDSYILIVDKATDDGDLCILLSTEQNNHAIQLTTTPDGAIMVKVKRR